MTSLALPMPAAVFFAIVFGGAVVVVATVQAIRTRAGAGLWWVALAGLGQAFLGLGAAAQDPAGDGARAAALQILAVVAALVLAGLCSRAPDPVESARSSLSLFGRALVWASLLGFPATVGFHSKVILLRSLLDLDWTGLAVLVLAAGTAAMWPALAALQSPFGGRVGVLRRLGILALILVLLAPGLYPHWAIVAADWLARVAFS